MLKIKPGYMLREIAGHFAVFPLGSRTVEFTGVITLNESGAFLWESMTNEISEDELTNKFMLEYGVDTETARQDIKDFTKVLKDNDLLVLE